MRAVVFLLCALGAAACGSPDSNIERAGLDPATVTTGYTFLTSETKALQDDDFANPGFLWVDRGRTLFNTGAKACSSCHSETERSLDRAAVNHPKYDASRQQLINLEGRINICREEQQGRIAHPYESDELLSLTAYVANLSRGKRTQVDATGAAASHYENGRAYFFTRRGQLNLACSTCHDQNWGKKLRGDTISQGHANGFPAYRFEWQSLGSLHRRFRDCDTGVRAEPLEYGSQTYIDLELYLAVRSNELEIETPAVRR